MNERAHTILFYDTALEQIADLPDAVFGKLEQSLSLLEKFPELGKPYTPSLDEADPPSNCRVLYVPKTTKSIYYMVNAASSELWVFWIGDTRSDPMARFTGVHLKDSGNE